MKNEEKKELNEKKELIDKEAEQVTGGVNEELAALRAEKSAKVSAEILVSNMPECT